MLSSEDFSLTSEYLPPNSPLILAAVLIVPWLCDIDVAFITNLSSPSLSSSIQQNSPLPVKGNIDLTSALIITEGTIAIFFVSICFSIILSKGRNADADVLIIYEALSKRKHV